MLPETRHPSAREILHPDRLHRMGFVSWRYIKWDHGYWKIDDARRENGHQYDLKLEAGTFDIVRLERERD